MVYIALLISVLLYGCEAWQLNNTLVARLDHFDSPALSRIEGINWSQQVTNQTLSDHTQVPSVAPSSNVTSARAGTARSSDPTTDLRMPNEHHPGL